MVAGTQFKCSIVRKRDIAIGAWKERKIKDELIPL
jgi:hypothetical protein